MSVLDEIKNFTSRRTMKMFEANVKKMTAQQILSMMTDLSNNTAKEIIQDVENGMTVEELKTKWRMEQ